MSLRERAEAWRFFPVQVLSEPAVIGHESFFLAGLLPDAKALPSRRFRDGISVRDVPADALDLGEFELRNPRFPMLVHRPNLVYDTVNWRKRLPPHRIVVRGGEEK